MEVDCITQITGDNNMMVNVSCATKQSTHSLEIPFHNIEQVATSKIISFQECKPKETRQNENSLVTEEIVESMHNFNSETAHSNRTVSVIGSSEITDSNVQTVMNIDADLGTGKEDVQSLFPLNSFSIDDGKIHHVVTLVDNLNTVEETSQQTVMLLNKVSASSPVTHITLMENHNPSQENLVILPLGDAKVAIIQNENFSEIQGNNSLVLGDQSSLLDLMPDQNELINQTQENVNQVTVYLPP